MILICIVVKPLMLLMRQYVANRNVFRDCLKLCKKMPPALYVTSFGDLAAAMNSSVLF